MEHGIKFSLLLVTFSKTLELWTISGRNANPESAVGYFSVVGTTLPANAKLRLSITKAGVSLPAYLTTYRAFLCCPWDI